MDQPGAREQPEPPELKDQQVLLAQPEPRELPVPQDQQEQQALLEQMDPPAPPDLLVCKVQVVQPAVRVYRVPPDPLVRPELRAYKGLQVQRELPEQQEPMVQQDQPAPPEELVLLEQQE